MEEDEYKATYREIAQNRCVFEKALTNNRCKCRHSRHFWLADREGYACKSGDIASKCGYLLEKLRENSRFILKLNSIGKQLPHNMEIRVQVGGLRGVRAVLGGDEGEENITDVWALVEQAERTYLQLELLPFDEIVQHVASFKGRSRRQGANNK